MTVATGAVRQRSQGDDLIKAKTPRIAIIEMLIPEYKVHLFRGLHERLGGQLIVCHSRAVEKDGPPAYEGDASFAQVTVQAYRIPVWRKRRALYQRVIPELERYRPDVVIMQDGVRILSNIAVRAWCRRRRIPIVLYTHGHNHQISDRGRLWHALVEGIRGKVLRGADAAIAYTKPVAEELVRKGLPRARVFVSPNTLDVYRVHDGVARVSQSELENVRKGLHIESDRVVLFLGRLIPEKRPHLLIEAARIAKDYGRPFHVLFVGEGPLRPTLDRLKTTLGPLGVSFLGHLPSDSVAPYLKLSDLVCVPGMTGLAIVHAFAAGRPYVTCASRDHSPEICYLRDGGNGLLVSPPTAEELAKSLMVLMDDPARRDSMGRSAREFALAECDPARQVQGFLDAVMSTKACSQVSETEI